MRLLVKLLFGLTSLQNSSDMESSGNGRDTKMP